MSPCLRHALLPLLLCGSLCAAGAEPAAQVVWGMTPWPGLVDVRDGRPSSGIIVELLGEITARLPEYAHRSSLTNLSRGLEQLRRDELSCFLPTFRTAERDRFAHYVGLFVSMPHQLVVRERERQAIAAGQATVSLRQVLATEHLRGGLMRDRSYGPQLDPLLQGENPRLLRIQTSGAGNNLFDMLEHGRIDYLLEYAEVFGSLQRAGGAAELSLLPLREADTPAVSGIYCSKTAAGALLVRRIDEVARRPEVIAAFIRAQHAYVPAATLEHYRPWLEAFFRHRGASDLTSLSR